MTIKQLNSVIKGEKIKAVEDISIKVNIQNPDGTWRIVVVPIENYRINQTNGFQLECTVWDPNDPIID